jgi:hypothetical protein
VLQLTYTTTDKKTVFSHSLPLIPGSFPFVPGHAGQARSALAGHPQPAEKEGKVKL